MFNHVTWRRKKPSKMFWMRHFLVVSLTIFCFNDVWTEEEYRDECEVWQEVIEKMKEEDNLEVECIRNRQCTGFDCKGKYVYQGTYTVHNQYTMDICFGVFIRPCNKPRPNLHFYIELLETNSTFQQNVTHSDIYQIPGSHFSLTRLMTADGFVQVDMNNTITYQHRRAMELGMFVKVRTNLFGHESYPDDFKVTLIPDSIIPVPDCDPSVRLPSHQPYTCGYDKPLPTLPPTTPPPAGSTRPTQPMFYPGTPCKPSNSWKDLKATCGHHQKCVATGKDGQDGQCSCVENYKYNMTSKTCQTTMTGASTAKPTGPIHIGFGDASKDSGLSNKMVIIIAVCSVGGLFILVSVAGVVLVKYQRYKRRYARHFDDDDDDPIEVAT